jgi:hypothetical protein
LISCCRCFFAPSKTSRQGFLISDEICIDTDDNEHCAESVPGFKDHWRQWLETQNRKFEENAPTCCFTTGEGADLEEFLEAKQLRWRPMKCGAGSVLLFEPRMPIRFKFIVETTRRSLAVRFIGIGEDQNLECGDSWNEISLSHVRLEGPRKLRTDKESFSFAFSLAVEVFGLGSLSDALIGRRKWDSELVRQERDHVLGCNAIAFANYYKAWKDQAKQTALSC